MLIEYIEELRKEPKEVRRQAAFFWTLVLVSIIVLAYIGFVVAKNTLPDTESEATIAAPYEAEVNR